MYNYFRTQVCGYDDDDDDDDDDDIDDDDYNGDDIIVYISDISVYMYIPQNIPDKHMTCSTLSRHSTWWW